MAKDIPDQFYQLSDYFFPGPLTIILKKKEALPWNISSNETIAVRMPNEEHTLKIIKLLGDPIVGTSANISNQKSPTSAKETIKDFQGKVSAIIDTGDCPIGIPSTIINLVSKDLEIIREGTVSKEEIEDILKKKL